MRAALPSALVLTVVLLAGLAGGCGDPSPPPEPPRRAAEPERRGPHEGEVVALPCYLQLGASGESHRPCAEACLKRGVPAGLLMDDGQVLVLLPEVGPSGMPDFPALAARRCRVEGAVVRRGGLLGLVVRSIAPVASAPTVP